ncbi:hypothetical protein P873_02950 [Arenimonas composti TR7-09 = DSM 18010]|uniref:N-acetyltransferase domain-containing protein n=2 Tax=Arenimonas TaxID=490567 RepID=A0A091BI56_9GAMM|nr:hypothetical protein P873_02950 [Arenimonas composti TR7-09 = DSM 18010]
MKIRKATATDASTLAALSRETFRQAFGHLYPPEDLQAFFEDAYSVARQLAAITTPGHAVFLLEREGEAVGYAAVGPCGLPHPEAVEADGELKRLYLLRDVQNGGHGGRLFQAALDWLQRDGPRRLWIGVYSDNHGAQRFYARHGFERVGEYHFPVGRVRDLEFILRRG